MDERISDKSFPRLTVGALARCKPLRFNGRGEAGEGAPVPRISPLDMLCLYVVK